MQLFEDAGNVNIEGLDTTNACYGGTNAVFNTLAWLESSNWDGQYGVTSDIAMVPRPYHFTYGGAAVAVLFGPNAPMQFLSSRVSHIADMADVYELYKRVGWHESAPVFDKCTWVQVAT